MRLAISAGEASGDAYAEALVREAIRVNPNLQIEAIGGQRLAKTSAKIVADSSKWGAVGIIESLRVAPRILGGYYRMKRALRSGTPGVFIAIDFGYANIRLARLAKNRGWKVLYFIPPGSWRRTKQGADLPKVADLIVTPFPWSAEILNDMGARAYFFGHPLVEMIGPADDHAPRAGIALLPGSREHEILHNFGPVVEALAKWPNEPVTVAAAPTVTADQLKALWVKCGGDPKRLHVSSDRHQVLKSAKAAIVCSGTATLEAALCDCPTVVVYRGSKLFELEAKLRKPKFDFISLPNILLGRALLPELILWNATAGAIEQALTPLLEPSSSEAAAQLAGFGELRETLGQQSAISKTVELLAHESWI